MRLEMDNCNPKQEQYYLLELRICKNLYFNKKRHQKYLVHVLGNG